MEDHTATSYFCNREQFEYLNNYNDGPIYNPTNIAMESDFSYWTPQIKNLIRWMESLEIENNRLHSKMHALSTRIFEVEGENLSLKQMLHGNKEQENLHPPHDALHA